METKAKCKCDVLEQHYQLTFTNLVYSGVQLIGWNHHTPNHKSKVKAWLKYALPDYAKKLKPKLFESKYGHGWGFRVNVDGGYFSFEGHHLTKLAERELQTETLVKHHGAQGYYQAVRGGE